MGTNNNCVNLPRLVLFCLAVFAVVLESEGRTISPLDPAGPKTKIPDVRGSSVLLPAHPDCQERRAAKLLAEGIGKLTGFTPQVVEEGASLPSGTFFAVGRTALAEKAHVAPLTSEQGYKLTISDGNVFVTGGTRGPFQAVVALLEEDWGARWFTRYASPKYPKTAVDGLTVTPRQFVPPFDVREYLHVTGMDATWAMFNRCMNMSYYIHTTRETGGGYVAEEHFCHNYADLVPMEKYFKTHPEYFMLVGGKRMKNGNGMNDGQVCFTSPGVETVMSTTLDAYLDAHPDVRVVGLTANDNLNLRCECPTCLSLYEREGAVGLQMDLANRVARRLKAKHPGVTLYTWAYAATQLPPPATRPPSRRSPETGYPSRP